MDPVFVVMRCHNDMPLLADTLDMLARQDHPHRLLVCDNASTDGSRERAQHQAERMLHVPAGQYVPGRVLNQAMAQSQGEYVVFLNSDCTPVDASWLTRLLEGFTDETVAGVFGRQIPRPDCHGLFAKDTEDAYGDGSQQARWRHCFSMAASAIRRSVWEKIAFDETLRYSEDVDWTWRARLLGHRIRYVPQAVVMHSHNYRLRQYYRRQFGEAQAEAHIFEWSPWQRSFLRYAVLPYGRRVCSDLLHCASHGDLAGALLSPWLRLVGFAGRWRGLQEGLRVKEPRSEAVTGGNVTWRRGTCES